MTHLTLPIYSPALSAIIAEEWPGERGVAKLAGVDPDLIRVVFEDLWTIGGFDLETDVVEPTKQAYNYARATDVKRAIRCALLSLADALEARGLVVDREGGVRVRGWAATDSLRYGLPKMLRRWVDLEAASPWDPGVKAWRESVLRSRLSRDDAARGPVGAAGSMGKGEMSMGRSRR